MPYTGQEDHSITLAQAADLTKNYRTAAGTGAPLGGYFGKAAIQDILSQQGCNGIRIYNARTTSGVADFVIVGVDSSGEDLEDGHIAEHSVLCPPYCPQDSKLAGTD